MPGKHAFLIPVSETLHFLLSEYLGQTSEIYVFYEVHKFQKKIVL